MSKKKVSRAWKGAGLGLATAGLIGGAIAATNSPGATAATSSATTASTSTTTPIKHLVVLFDENVSFDHYFGTYPKAANLPNDGAKFTGTKPVTTGKPVNNYLSNPKALSKNPNAVAPFRLSANQAVTCDQNHNYKPEQTAIDGGKMDQFVESVSSNPACGSSTQFGTNGLTMGYYDGNTVTGLWNYAQRYAMSDNSWDATFGPSTPGALNLISGQTYGATSYLGWKTDNTSTSTDPVKTATPDTSYGVMDPTADGVGTVINDPDPAYDDCNDSNHTSGNSVVGMSGQNVGDLLNEKGVTWGWFQGGFTPTAAYDPTTGTAAVCGAKHNNVTGYSSLDYSPHHNPFEYYKSTSNPHHYPGTPGVAVGADDPSNDTTQTGANHEYDLTVFDQAAQAGNLPAVSFVKAAEYQDGHASYSDPTDEQNFIVHTINELEQSPEWSSTAVVIAYDDSDGWYDHVAPVVTNGSASPTNDTTLCSSVAAKKTPLGGYQDRCGPSQRLPFLVISPYAKKNYVSHTLTTQPSITKFIEDNWLSGQRIGDGSFDATAGSITDMFTTKARPGVVLLNSNGTVAKDTTKSTGTTKKHKKHKPAKHHPKKHKSTKKNKNKKKH